MQAKQARLELNGFFFISCQCHTTLYYCRPEFSHPDRVTCAIKFSSVQVLWHAWHIVSWVLRAGSSAEL